MHYNTVTQLAKKKKKKCKLSLIEINDLNN